VSELSKWVKNDNVLAVKFVSVVDEKELLIQFTEKDSILNIYTEDMELAGSLINDIASFLHVQELDVQAEFQQEIDKIKSLLVEAEQYNVLRSQLSANIADVANNVKVSIVKAEDARVLRDMPLLKKVYTSLQQDNGQLITEYTKRQNNYEQLVKCLKEINLLINKAASLRIGSDQSKVVSMCRAAIKSNNTHLLAQIIKTGKES